MKIEWLPKSTAHEEIYGMDAFRGLAAILVLLFHFWTFYLLGREVTIFGLNITAPFAAGHLGVDLFFILSGFLVFLSLVRTSSVASYFRKRAWRIFPLAVFFTVTVFLLKLDYSFPAILDAIAHIFFVQGLFPATYHGLHPVMWTLTVEVIFYVSLPLILFLGRKKLTHFLEILFFLTVLNFAYRFFLIRYFPGWSPDERIFYSEQFWGRFDQFTLGICLGLIFLFRERWKRGLERISGLFLGFGLISLVSTFILFASLGSGFRDIPFLQVFLHFFVGLAFAIFLLGYLFAPLAVKRIFAPRSFIFLGMISYSIYLWHFPVTSVISKVISDPVIGFFVILFFTIMLSFLSYLFLEKPFLRRKTLSSTEPGNAV